jgi:hypothetical protein
VTSALDERGGRPNFWVLLTASSVSPPVYSLRRSLRSRCLRLGGGSEPPLLTSSVAIRELETPPMRARAPAKMPRRLTGCRDPL